MDFTKAAYSANITRFEVRDVRFPTSLVVNDAVHNADFSTPYLVIHTDIESVTGHGFTLTIGRGNDIVCHAISDYFFLLKGKQLRSIFSSFGQFWNDLVMDSQLRWLGPEKGVVHLAAAAIINALWDMWAIIEGKPLWKMIADMTPEELVSTMDFHYLREPAEEEEKMIATTITIVALVLATFLFVVLRACWLYWKWIDGIEEDTLAEDPQQDSGYIEDGNTACECYGQDTKRARCEDLATRLLEVIEDSAEPALSIATRAAATVPNNSNDSDHADVQGDPAAEAGTADLHVPSAPEPSEVRIDHAALVHA